MNWYIIIMVCIDIMVYGILSRSTIARTFLRIARPEATFLKMRWTCADQFSDSSVIKPNDFVVSTMLISKLPTLIASYSAKPLLRANYHVSCFAIIKRQFVC